VSRSLSTRLSWIAALAFASGFPFGLINEALPVYLRTQGAGLVDIGRLAAITAPWSLKFLWAPLVDRLGTRSKLDWFRDIIAAGVPCGPINTIDAGVAFAAEIGLDPVVEVGPPGSAVPSVRNPITLSESPVDYRYPPPGLDEHGAEIRVWLADLT